MLILAPNVNVKVIWANPNNLRMNTKRGLVILFCSCSTLRSNRTLKCKKMHNYTWLKKTVRIVDKAPSDFLACPNWHEFNIPLSRVGKKMKSKGINPNL